MSKDNSRRLAIGWTPRTVLCLLAGLVSSLACGSAVTNGDDPPPPCIPATCAEIEAQCGIHEDGCGGSFTCGSCPDEESCVGGLCVPDCEPDCPDEEEPPLSPLAGLFIDLEDLERARDRGPGSESIFESSYQLVLGRAATARDDPIPPFTMDDVTEIRFGWCGEDRGQPGTLSKATSDFERGSDRYRTLALAFALTGDEGWAQAAAAQMKTWAEEQTLVNLYDLGADLRAGRLDAQTEGFCSDRPWNFALDTMWQAYGLINSADAYLLLTRNGHSFSSEDDALLRDWILRAAEAVNSSFRAWTEWADAHPNSGSFERYRSDNHLSWALAGLIAAAAALEDGELATYVLDGGSFEDRRGGAYSNPSHIRDVIGRAIEGGADPENEGRIYEELILRDPPIGYSLFHLWAISLVALVAEVHFDDDLWSYAGPDGAGIRHAYERYAAFLLGERESPRPDQDGDLSRNRWQWELAYRRWPEAHLAEPIALGARGQYIVQSIGPVSLLLGRDIGVED